MLPIQNVLAISCAIASRNKLSKIDFSSSRTKAAGAPSFTVALLNDTVSKPSRGDFDNRTQILIDWSKVYIMGTGAHE